MKKRILGAAAELAFMVEENYQGPGITSRLLRHLVQIGRQKNVSRFVADVLSGNQAMLRVFAGSGLPIKQQREGAVVQVTQAVYEQARARHPERWSGGIHNCQPITEVWLNPSAEVAAAPASKSQAN